VPSAEAYRGPDANPVSPRQSSWQPRIRAFARKAALDRREPSDLAITRLPTPLARGLLTSGIMGRRMRAWAPSAFVAVAALGVLGLGAGCNEPAPPSMTDPPLSESWEGEPCDRPGFIAGHGFHSECEQCVCSDAGTWHCPTTCAENYVRDSAVGLLVVVDDSSSMGPDRQARLAMAMPELLAALDEHPDPIALRVAVTTTDHTSPACDPATADDGALQLRSCMQHLEDFAPPAGPTEEPIPADAAERACASVCDLPELRTVPSPVPGSAELRVRPWLERRGEWSNLEGSPDFAAALACAMPQGLRGCDFESPLQSMVAALWRGVDPDDLAAGFVANEGPMTVLLVTDEDDCSAVEEWGTVFDPDGSRRFWSDPEADAPTSAVCWNTGIVCEGGPGTYDECHPENIDTAEHVGAPEEHAVLTPVNAVIRELYDIEQARPIAPWDDGMQLAIIGGVPPGYATDEAELVITDGQDDPEYALRYGVGPGCRDEDEAAVPPVRLRGVSGALHSACDDDYGPALAAVGEGLVARLGTQCYFGCAADADPAAPGLQATCWAQEEWGDPATGQILERPIPLCDGDRLPEGADVCVVLRHDEALATECAEDGANLELALRRDPTAPRPASSLFRVMCATADPEVHCPESV
jgi:hypothetical protein